MYLVVSSDIHSIQRQFNNVCPNPSQSWHFSRILLPSKYTMLSLLYCLLVSFFRYLFIRESFLFRIRGNLLSKSNKRVVRPFHRCCGASRSSTRSTSSSRASVSRSCRCSCSTCLRTRARRCRSPFPSCSRSLCSSSCWPRSSHRRRSRCRS